MLAAGTQIAASSVAEYLGAPYRFVAFDPIMLPSSEHPPFSIPWPDLPRSLNRLTWTLQDALTRLRIRPLINRERERLGLPPVDDPYALCLGPRPILAAEEILAPPPSDAKEVQTIGCLHPFDETPLPEKLEQFLSAGAPPIFVGPRKLEFPPASRVALDTLCQNIGVRLSNPIFRHCSSIEA